MYSLTLNLTAASLALDTVGFEMMMGMALGLDRGEGGREGGGREGGRGGQMMMMGMALGLGRGRGRDGGQKQISRRVVVVAGVHASLPSSRPHPPIILYSLT